MFKLQKILCTDKINHLKLETWCPTGPILNIEEWTQMKLMWTQVDWKLCNLSLVLLSILISSKKPLPLFLELIISCFRTFQLSLDSSLLCPSFPDPVNKHILKYKIPQFRIFYLWPEVPENLAIAYLEYHRHDKDQSVF